MSHQENIENWSLLAGICLLTFGCGIQWGVAAGMIAVGAFLAVWPLVKEIARSH